jgi:hypothetical protein
LFWGVDKGVALATLSVVIATFCAMLIS